MIRYIIQKDCSGDSRRIDTDRCSQAHSVNREYMGRDGTHVLRNATSYAIADFALCYGFVSTHLAEALVQHIQSMERIVHQDAAVEHVISYNVIPIYI